MFFKMVCLSFVLTNAVPSHLEDNSVIEETEEAPTWVLSSEEGQPCFSLQMEVMVC